MNDTVQVSFCDKCMVVVHLNDRYCGRCIWSIDQSNAIKLGIYKKKKIGLYKGGRPQKRKDLDEIKNLYLLGLTYRQIAGQYNSKRPNLNDKLSHTEMFRVIKSFIPADIQITKAALKRTQNLLKRRISFLEAARIVKQVRNFVKNGGAV